MTCHVSLVSGHVSHVKKWLRLSVEVLLSTGPTIGSSVTTDKCTGHWCIKVIYHGFAIAREYTLKLYLLVSVLFKSCLFSECPLGYLGEVTKVCLAVACGFLGFRHF